MKLVLALAFAMLSTSVQAANITVIDGNAKFPEGPFVEKGILYYAQYGASEVDMWDGKTRTTIWSKDGSGSNAVQRFGEGFIIAG
ncbi:MULTISPECIES: hypothetical protein [unclassified Mesorhizobium]|nr:MULTISPECIES: hypothetical protein [unclassified Mesorhizobium]MBZ9739703.1 hypothetical protein [Mesorhizobium sp. CO1-1-4]MBZ9805033.1 hypothetical protein [Mesorhizobium sp. ES1-6]